MTFPTPRPRHLALALLCGALAIGPAACGSAPEAAPQAGSTSTTSPSSSPKEGTTQYFNANTPIQQVVDDPAFSGFGRLLFPSPSRSIPDSMTLADAGRLMPYHSHIDTNTTVDVLNDLKARAERGERIFTPIYSEQEMRRDPAKRNTGRSSSKAGRVRPSPRSTQAAASVMSARFTRASRMRCIWHATATTRLRRSTAREGSEWPMKTSQPHCSMCSTMQTNSA